MVAEIFNSSVYACFGHLCPHNIMQIGLTCTNNDPNILELLISSETTHIKRPSRIQLSRSSSDYVSHNSHVGKSVFDIYNVCRKSLSKDDPQLPQLEIV